MTRLTDYYSVRQKLTYRRDRLGRFMARPRRDKQVAERGLLRGVWKMISGFLREGVALRR